MKKTILLFTILLISSFGLFAQTEATTKDGKKVTLNDNGTWIYAETSETEEIVSFECADLISSETDKISGRTITGAIRRFLVANDARDYGFAMTIMMGAGSLILNIKVVGASSCVDDDNKMNLLFRDGTRLELKNIEGFNCKSTFTVYFGGGMGNTKALHAIRTKEVETMRVWTSDGFVEKDFSSEQSKKFMKIFDCLRLK